jgi:hypothetical protein
MAHANVVPARATLVDTPPFVASRPPLVDVDVRVPLLARSNARRAAFDVAIRRTNPFVVAATADVAVVVATCVVVVVVVFIHP